MISRRILAAVALLCALIAPAHAQQNQCRTSPVGASTAYCASEAFVTESAAAVPVLPATTKAQQQVGTSNSVAVTPLHQQDHDSAAKAWVTFTGSTGAILASYNVASVTRSAVGVYTITFTVPFATANYICHVAGVSASVDMTAQPLSKTAGSVSVATFNINSSPPVTADPTTVDVVFFGRQ